MLVDTRRTTEAPGDRLVDLLRRPTEPDEVGARSCAIAVGIW